jgi:hypothetical protein
MYDWIQAVARETSVVREWAYVPVLFNLPETQTENLEGGKK